MRFIIKKSNLADLADVSLRDQEECIFGENINKNTMPDDKNIKSKSGNSFFDPKNTENHNARRQKVRVNYESAS